jgi:type VII secretion-associated serine protease mycosin
MLVALLAALVVALVPAAPARADWIRDGQWQLASLHAATAWTRSTGTGVVVAVLDSGVDADHPDLVGRVLPGADFVDGSTDGRTDFVGHGTTVAALIAGRGDDHAGVVGLAPNARILPVRVLDRANRYIDAGTVARGLRWAVDHGASVVNMSLGGANRSGALADAIWYAWRHDVVVVACTGNVEHAEPTDVWYPAREPGVLAVAGMTESAHGDRLWRGGLTGRPTALTAPADDLLGARPGGYWRVQGTSFAAPLVAATAALVRARWPRLDADNVINRLIRTAHDLGPRGRDSRYGYGEVDPARALTAVVPTVRHNPLGSGRRQAIGPVEPGLWPGSEAGHGGPVGAEVPVATQPRASVAAPAGSGWRPVTTVALLVLAIGGMFAVYRRDATHRYAGRLRLAARAIAGRRPGD